MGNEIGTRWVSIVIHRSCPHDPRRHVTDGQTCWCRPVVRYVCTRLKGER